MYFVVIVVVCIIILFLIIFFFVCDLVCDQYNVLKLPYYVCWCIKKKSLSQNIFNIKISVYSDYAKRRTKKEKMILQEKISEGHTCNSFFCTILMHRRFVFEFKDVYHTYCYKYNSSFIAV